MKSSLLRPKNAMCSRMLSLPIFFLIFSSTTVATSVLTEEKDASSPNCMSCPEGEVSLLMSGVDSGNRLAEAWKKAYKSEYCPDFDINFQTNRHESAASRVCDSSLIYSPTDMASMPGSFFFPQAFTDDGWSFQCKRSSSDRNTILLHMAQEGITLGVKANSNAAACIELLGGGLTNDQLRWMFSRFTARVLESNGWNPSSVPFSDGNDNTHLWSELNENCTASEIVLAVEEQNDEVGETGSGKSSVYDFFVNRILKSQDETTREYFSTSDLQELDEFMNNNDGQEGIAVMHLYDMLSAEYRDQGLHAVGIQNKDGNFIMPSAKAFEDGDYPFLRKLYFSVVDSSEALALTRPFLEFALSDQGTEILKASRFWPIREWEKLAMYTRLNSKLGYIIGDIRKSCGPTRDGRILIGGSDTVRPVAHVWSEIYKLGCPYKIDVKGGGSTLGAGRVCWNSENMSGSNDGPVDIGMMSRDWDESEAVATKQDFVYACQDTNEKDNRNNDDGARSVIQVDVALDGITIMFSLGGMGETCIKLLGGLTMDQLRWIYSSYSDTELEATGWDPRSLKNSDFDSSTHLWSELDSRCALEEIKLAGDYWNDGSFTSFYRKVLTDWKNGESIARNRPKPYKEAYGFDILKYMLEHGDAISFVGYHYFFEHQDVFWAAPIKNNEVSRLRKSSTFIHPSEETIKDGSYPLVRSIYMNLLNDKDSLRDSIPLIKFGFSRPELISSSGYVPILGDHLKEMLDRLNEAPYTNIEMQGGSGEVTKRSGSIGIVFGIIAAILLLFFAGIAIVRNRRSN